MQSINTLLSKENLVAASVFARATDNKMKICIASMIMKPIDLSIWLDYHRKMGVSLFYIRLEETPELIDYLKKQEDVILEIGESDKNGNNYLTQNHRQDKLVNDAIDKCIKLNYDWIFHIDSDELLDGDFAFLNNLSLNIKCLKLFNAEAIYNENQDNCFSSNTFLKCVNGANCRSYSNGKAGGRPLNGLKSFGPHTFIFNDINEGDHIYQIPFDKLHILHYDSCSFEKWVDKFRKYGINNKSNIPFSFYNESINIINSAYDLYKKNTMYDINNINEELIYKKK